jgi:hypothetical protein
MQNNFPLIHDIHPNPEEASISLTHIHATASKKDDLNIVEITKNNELVFAFKKAGEDVCLSVYKPGEIDGTDAIHTFAQALKLLNTNKDDVDIQFECEKNEVKDTQVYEAFIQSQLAAASLKNYLYNKYVYNQ